MLFYFGRDANIVWQHGINALPAVEQDSSHYAAGLPQRVSKKTPYLPCLFVDVLRRNDTLRNTYTHV